MHLLSCKKPKRIFNKYINEYVWVPCGECNICKNRRAAKYTALLERERMQHAFSFFVTLTYDEQNIPLLTPGDFVQRVGSPDCYYSSREKDGICITFNDIFLDDKKDLFDQADIDFFNNWVQHGGLPICSRYDVQTFLKRLNKFIHDNITHQYKNFRYFIVSEYGCTTFRSHYHGIFFVDNQELASVFSDCIAACWKNTRTGLPFGRVDSKPVENSACAYCAQYINKCTDLPYVYQQRKLRPFFLCSRNPFIGAFSQCPEDDSKMVNDTVVTQAIRKKASDTSLTVVPLESSYQNRLFPKCPLYGTIPDTFKFEMYRFASRLRAESCKDFMNKVFDLVSLECEYQDDFSNWVRSLVSFSDVADSIYQCDHRQPWKLFDEYTFNLLRRIYYTCCKISRQAKAFGISVRAYVQKIIEYYKKKELYLLHEQYNYQAEVADTEPESIACMYPEYLFQNGISLKEYIDDCECTFAQMQIKDSDYWAESNKKTHFKNAYLDSLQFKKDCYFLYCLIKSYYYAKKRDEIIEAIAP